MTAVEAAIAIGDGVADGATLGSKELIFKPGKIRHGDYRFAVGTAGSATLVLQTILPALLTGTKSSRLTLEGGTHNPHAPPFDFLAKSFLPLIQRMGPIITTKLDRLGFYPAGGGKFTVTISPVPKLERIQLLERGEIKSRLAQVADRELKIITEKLGWTGESLQIEEIPSNGHGNVILIEIESAEITEVFTGFGERGIQAESAAESVVSQVRDYLAVGVPVGEHLADQLLIPLALARTGAFKTFPLSRHSQTNIEVISKFLPAQFTIEKQHETCLISV